MQREASNGRSVRLDSTLPQRIDPLLVFLERRTMATNTKSPVLAHHVTSVDALNTLFEQRFAPVTFTVPDYENSVVEVRMLNAGEEEHASSFAREPDGSRNNDRYMRMYVAYGMVNPLLAEDRDARVQAEKI